MTIRVKNKCNTGQFLNKLSRLKLQRGSNRSLHQVFQELSSKVEVLATQKKRANKSGMLII